MKLAFRLLSAALAPLTIASLRAQSNYATPYAFTTLAGSAPLGSADGIGSAARFSSPSSVAVDANGNVYVADALNHTIRKITTSGLVTTLAGTAGITGSADGVGGAAQFMYIPGLAVDAGGNVYVADWGNNSIRKITPGGVVTTFAGMSGKLHGATDGTGSAAQFYNPSGVAVDRSGNVYVADTSNNTIRKITPGGTVTTLAGKAYTLGARVDGAGSAARFNYPTSVAADASGNVYVADCYNQSIRMITPGSVVSTLAGSSLERGSVDGTGFAARFNYPNGVATDGAGNIYVADTYNNTIRKITAAGAVTTMAGIAGLYNYGSADGLGAAAQFYGPQGVAVDQNGGVWVADTGNNAVRKISPGAEVTTVAGQSINPGSADGTGDAARFNNPIAVAADGNSSVYVADTNNHTIRKITAGGVVTTLAGTAGMPGNADGLGADARFNYPRGVASDTRGNLYVADTSNYTIRKITAQGVVTTLAGSSAGFFQPTSVAVDGSGNIYVTNAANEIRKVAFDGNVTKFAGRTLDSNANCVSVAVDRSGTVYGSYSDNTIRRVTPDGAATIIAGISSSNVGSVDGIGSTAQFYHPYGIAVDGSGIIYVADVGNYTIRSITPTGIVATVAGTAGIADSLDGWGSAARFASPTGIAVDPYGNLFVADSVNNAIRKGVPSANVIVTTSISPGQAVNAGASITFSVATAVAAPLAYQWCLNSAPIAGATNSTLTQSNVLSAETGLYSAIVTNAGGSSTSDPVIVGLSMTSKVIGAGSEIAHGIFVAANGNTFDQVLPSGAAVTVTAEPGKITRTSLIDLTNDIVQVEFSGAGTLSLVLDNPSGPAIAANYNQPTVSYMKGHAGIVITGADDTTNVSVFSVGTLTAVNQALFKAGVTYDGMADLAFIAIASTNGKFGGVRTANGSYYAAKGLTGLYAPGVQFTGPVYVGDINASAAATPVLLLGSVSDARITGGDLLQSNGQPVKVSGITQLKFTAGSTSHGVADLPAQINKAVLQQNGVDVTAQIVVIP